MSKNDFLFEMRVKSKCNFYLILHVYLSVVRDFKFTLSPLCPTAPGMPGGPLRPSAP